MSDPRELNQLIRKHREETEDRCKATKKTILTLRDSHPKSSARYEILDVLLSLTQKCAIVAGSIYTEYATAGEDDVPFHQLEKEVESMKSLALRIFDGYEAIATNNVVAEIVTPYGSVKAYIQRLQRDWTLTGVLSSVLLRAGVVVVGFLVNTVLGCGLVVSQLLYALYDAFTEQCTPRQANLKLKLQEMKRYGDALEEKNHASESARDYLSRIERDINSILKMLLEPSSKPLAGLYVNLSPSDDALQLVRDLVAVVHGP